MDIFAAYLKVIALRTEKSKHASCLIIGLSLPGPFCRPCLSVKHYHT